MRAWIVAAAIAAALAGCSHPAAGTTRFVVQPPVWKVNDRTPFDRAPAKRTYMRSLYQLDGFVVRRATRAMDLPPDRRAADINALDEVPDSTWFTNRIGARELSAAELEAAGRVHPSPLDALPWTIHSVKTGGLSLGFVFTDTRGDKYLLKFDNADVPEMETGAHMIGRAIVWACGYNVPEDYLGYVERSDLRLAKDATRSGPTGGKKPLTEDYFARALETVARSSDGRYRVLASRLVPGTPIGPFAREGTRGDDPNDLIPHEQRRVLRGQATIFAWLNHTDIQEDQSIDSFVPDAPGSKRGYVRHYVIDFGKALGVMGYTNRWRTPGYTFRVDLRYALESLVGLGLWHRPWDSLDAPPIRGVGLWTAKHYDPGAWRTNSPYWPFLDRDRFDAFWAAKLVMRFTPDQLAAIVEQARYSDPDATAYVLDVLIERQRATARYWFDRVAPLDAFAVTGDRLCFDDLTLTYRLDHVAPGTRYRVDAFDADGRPLGTPHVVRATTDGHACTEALPTPPGDGYTIVRLRVQRNGRALPPVRVHLARVDNRLSVIGIRRD